MPLSEATKKRRIEAKKAGRLTVKERVKAGLIPKRKMRRHKFYASKNCAKATAYLRRKKKKEEELEMMRVGKW